MLKKINFFVAGDWTGKSPVSRSATGGAWFSARTQNRMAWMRDCMVRAVAECQWPLATRAVAVTARIYHLAPRHPPVWEATAIELGMAVPIAKPDLDNVEKLIGDAGNLVLWRDDRVISAWDVRKLYTNTAMPRPGIAVSVEQLDSDEFREHLRSVFSAAPANRSGRRRRQ